MTKTTVYLPDDLKVQLSRLSAASGQSEAELIRTAVRSLVRDSPSPRPRGALFASGDTGLSARTEQALAGFGKR